MTAHKNFFPGSKLELQEKIGTKELEHVAIHFLDLHSLTRGFRDKILNQIYCGDLTVCDGFGASIISVIAGNKVNRTRGVDFLRYAILQSKESDKHFFFGASSRALEQIQLEAKKMNPAINIVGSFAPPYVENYNQLCEIALEKVHRTSANILWIGLSAPKQFFVANQVAKSFSGTTLAIGAAFDFYSKEIPESPKVLQTMGLEWFFRLLKEPRRLGSRYLVTFFFATLMIFCDIFDRIFKRVDNA
jgi:N-acetylglucosaminyldiphosphoundecaprenol N-acetyl-beta-D-mannosaminyltransferase